MKPQKQNNLWIIHFGSHIITINQKNQLFLDYEIPQIQRKYDIKTKKPYNIIRTGDKEWFTLKDMKNQEALKVTKGMTGRIFFNLFKGAQLGQFRGQPYEKWFYEDGLMERML